MSTADTQGIIEGGNLEGLPEIMRRTLIEATSNPSIVDVRAAAPRCMLRITVIRTTSTEYWQYNMYRLQKTSTPYMCKQRKPDNDGSPELKMGSFCAGNYYVAC